MSDTEQDYIEFEQQDPTFFAMIPKMAAMELKPFELALYCHYKQTASESGSCYKSVATLSEEAQMSVTKIKECRAELENKGYIRITRNPNDVDGNMPVIITIVNIWAINHQRYAPSRVATTPQTQSDEGVGVERPQRITNKEKSFTNSADAEISKSKAARMVGQRIISTPALGQTDKQKQSNVRQPLHTLETYLGRITRGRNNLLPYDLAQKLATPIIVNGVDYGTPAEMFEETELYPAYVNDKIKWWQENTDMQKDRLINLICKYDGQYGWIAYREAVENESDAPPDQPNDTPAPSVYI